MYGVTSKFPGCKLIRVKTEIKDDALFEPRISGDFYLAPTESLAVIERTLDGWPLNELNLLESVLSRVMDENRMLTAGISAHAIVETVRMLPGAPRSPTRTEGKE